MGRKELDQVLICVSARYSAAGKPTTANDVVSEFGWTLDEAQNRLEYLKKQGAVITPYKAKNPQQYYPAKAIESITTTKINNITELQDFWDFLVREGKGEPLHVHNIQILTQIHPDFYSKEYANVAINAYNHSKRFTAYVNGDEVNAFLYPNGRLQIFCTLSFKPFRLQDEGDIDIILIHLGEWRRALINAGLPHILPEPQAWELTHADFNKDIKNRRPDFSRDFHFTINNVIGSFRMYTKFMQNQLVYRVELSKDFEEKPAIPRALNWGLQWAGKNLGDITAATANPFRR